MARFGGVAALVIGVLVLIAGFGLQWGGAAAAISFSVVGVGMVLILGGAALWVIVRGSRAQHPA